MKTIFIALVFALSATAHASKPNLEEIQSAVYSAYGIILNGTTFKGNLEATFASALDVADVDANWNACLKKEFNKKAATYDDDVMGAFGYFLDVDALAFNIQNRLTNIKALKQKPDATGKEKLLAGELAKIGSAGYLVNDVISVLAKKQKVDSIAGHISAVCNTDGM